MKKTRVSWNWQWRRPGDGDDDWFTGSDGYQYRHDLNTEAEAMKEASKDRARGYETRLMMITETIEYSTHAEADVCAD